MEVLKTNKTFCSDQEIVEYLNQQSYLGRIKTLEIQDGHGRKLKYQLDDVQG